MIALLDLQDHLNKKIDELSGGQKRRDAPARTLVMKKFWNSRIFGV